MLDNGVSRLAIGRRAGEGFGMAPFTDSAAAILPGFASRGHSVSKSGVWA
jgi:protein-L-isoaspartate(D-aspartate) O-methyltransferase